MAITENDVRLFQSQRMTDNADGGGTITASVVVDGQDNNLFPDVTDIDRLQGRVNARKVFGAVRSNDTDLYLSAHLVLDDDPDDSAIDAAVLAYGGLSTDRTALAAALSMTPFDAGSTQTINYTGGTDLADWPATAPAVGTLLSINIGGVRHVRQVIAAGVSGNPARGQLDAVLGGSGSLSAPATALTQPTPGAQRFYGCGTTGALSSSGASSITVGKILQRVVPAVLTAAYPTVPNAAWLVDPIYYALTHGRVRVIAPGDLLLISNTQSMSPATVSNGQTVNTTRTSLARLRVIGANGVEHARFTAGVTPPTGVGCTADLAAGTVTFSDVSGLNQPVTIEHRIEQVAGCTEARPASGVIGLNTTLARDFPSGSKVSSMLMRGDLQGRVGQGFSQSTWTGVWSDTLIGTAPSAQFAQALNPITTTNKGAVTERWAAIFTSASAYRLIGEQLGEVGTGNTGTAFSPSNPVEGVPYLTIPAAGWGTGWSAGNVLRFNTYGTEVPLWALRTVAPSSPGGTDSVTLQFRGYINT